MKYVSLAKQLIQQISSVLVGKEDKVTNTVITLLAGGHLLLEDVPGVGKTTLANTLAKSIDCSFGRIQFTPDTLPSDITGISVYNMKMGAFEFQKGAAMHNIVLADEINRTAPKTQASLLEAMEEQQITVDGVIYPLEAPFMVIATQNPIEFVGTYHLPEAQMDRFLMKITIGYPSLEKEKLMVTQFLNDQRVEQLKPIMKKEDVVLMQQEVKTVKVHEDLVTYIVNIIDTTRKEESLTLGASPRATLAVIRAAQATAYLKERDFVIPDDVQEVVYPVLCHRMIQSMEAKINKVTIESTLKRLLLTVPLPIIRSKA